MEYFEGWEHFEFIKKNKKLSEKKTANVLQQILSAIDYIHKL